MKTPLLANIPLLRIRSLLFNLNLFLSPLIPDLESPSDGTLSDQSADADARIADTFAAEVLTQMAENEQRLFFRPEDSRTVSPVIHDDDNAATDECKLRAARDRKRENTGEHAESACASPTKRVRLPGIGYLNLR